MLAYFLSVILQLSRKQESNSDSKGETFGAALPLMRERLFPSYKRIEYEC